MATPQAVQQSDEASGLQDISSSTEWQGFTAENGGTLQNDEVPHAPSFSQNNGIDQDGIEHSAPSHQFSSIQPPSSHELNQSASAHNPSEFTSLAHQQHQQDQSSMPNPLKLGENGENSFSPPQDSDHVSTSSLSIVTQEAAPKSAKSPLSNLNVETGNIQALLDNLIATASSAASQENPNAPTSGTPSATAPQNSSPAESQTPISALPTPAGLPPRPPPQDEPSIHPNYAAGQSIRSYHNPPQPNTAQTQPAHNATSYQNPPNPSSASVVGPNGMPPPPSATFQQPSDPIQTVPREATPHQLQDDPNAVPGVPPLSTQLEVQQSQTLVDQEQAYQDFLRAEASYVAEGAWDRFPQGSRLFVGMAIRRLSFIHC